MTPVVAKVVVLAKTHPLRPQHITYRCIAIMLDLEALVGVLGVWLAIAHPTDRKEVQMIILPPHRELQEPVQTRQGDFAGDNNAPPDRRLDLLELNVKLVDALRAIAAHLSALLTVLFLWLVGRV